MRKPSKVSVAVGGIIVLAIAVGSVFQNCAKAKFVDPDTRHSAIALGLCQNCGGESGQGLSCRSSQQGTFSSCFYESCNPGFLLQNLQCAPVVCTPGSIGNCAVPHGEGRMTCNPSGLGYGSCTAVDCEVGYVLTGATCVAVEPPVDPPPVDPPPALCLAESHRDCSTDSTYGTETCNQAGSAYGECVFGDCKPGFNKDGGSVCVANSCEPSSVTPCTIGAGVGYKTCNSQGSALGSCEINGCQQGYVFKDGVCVVQVCTPGSEAVCEFAHGSGTKICNQDGTNYGECTLLGCEHAYTLQNSQCLEHRCTPSSQDTCVGESGSGVKYCYENGMGHGPCQLSSCDPGFKLKGGQCVSEDSCDEGETQTCTQQNGTGIRTCNTNSHKLGPCEITACNTDYELVNQGGSNACKKKK